MLQQIVIALLFKVDREEDVCDVSEGAQGDADQLDHHHGRHGAQTKNLKHLNKPCNPFHGEGEYDGHEERCSSEDNSHVDVRVCEEKDEEGDKKDRVYRAIQVANGALVLVSLGVTLRVFPLETQLEEKGHFQVVDRVEPVLDEIYHVADSLARSGPLWNVDPEIGHILHVESTEGACAVEDLSN